MIDRWVALSGKLNRAMRQCGVLGLFVVTTTAASAQSFTTLFNFDGEDGQAPYAGLVQATNGDFYGTTQTGGANNSGSGGTAGTIFKINDQGRLTSLYNFCSQSGCTDGYAPFANLIQATNGDFYGTTYAGGSPFCNNSGYCGSGTIFRMTPSGVLTTLHTFCSPGPPLCADGQYPSGLIQAADGYLYGTTGNGGANGGGVVFKMTPSGVLTTLYSFCAPSGCPAGYYPGTLVQAANGDFYGTTGGGGVANRYCASGCGTVFSITATGSLRTLYRFCSQSNCTDGVYPSVLAQSSDGDFYGTTEGGGNNNVNCLGHPAPPGCGTVFKMTPSGALTTLHAFCSQGPPPCADGVVPYAGLVEATNGDLYGTTHNGAGTYGYSGTIFQIDANGAFSTVYTFCLASCSFESFPTTGLTQGTNGDLYGTLYLGGENGDGTVYSLTVGLGPFVKTQTTSGKVGEAVKILGTDLTGASSVSFNGLQAAFAVQSPALITTTVPVGASSGTVQVVTPTGTLSSNAPFEVRP